MFEVKYISSLFPQGFDVQSALVCDRTASVLNMASCRVHVKSKSLFWSIRLDFRRDEGVELTEKEVRNALELWMPYLAKMVTDPYQAQ